MIKYEIKFYDMGSRIVGSWADDDKDYLIKLFNDTTEHDKDNIHDLLGLNESIELYSMTLINNKNSKVMKNFKFI